MSSFVARNTSRCPGVTPKMLSIPWVAVSLRCSDTSIPRNTLERTRSRETSTATRDAPPAASNTSSTRGRLSDPATRPGRKMNTAAWSSGLRTNHSSRPQAGHGVSSSGRDKSTTETSIAKRTSVRHVFEETGRCRPQESPFHGQWRSQLFGLVFFRVARTDDLFRGPLFFSSPGVYARERGDRSRDESPFRGFSLGSPGVSPRARKPLEGVPNLLCGTTPQA